MEHYILPSSSVNIRDEYLQKQKNPISKFEKFELKPEVEMIS